MQTACTHGGIGGMVIQLAQWVRRLNGEAHMIYVDLLHRTERNVKWKFSSGCHLFGDSARELHSFAAGLGLKKEWAIKEPFLHYFIVAGKRELAILAGAKEVKSTVLALKKIGVEVDRDEIPPAPQPTAAEQKAADKKRAAEERAKKFYKAKRDSEEIDTPPAPVVPSKPKRQKVEGML